MLFGLLILNLCCFSQASKGTKRKLIEDDAPESAGPEPPMGIGKEIVDHRNAASTSRASGSTSKIVFPKIASGIVTILLAPNLTIFNLKDS